MAILGVIRFDGLKSRDWLIYKYPSDSIVLGSQLIVQEGQTAIFVKGGMVADVFYPGTYTLSTGNLPILKKGCHKRFHPKTEPASDSLSHSALFIFCNTILTIELIYSTSCSSSFLLTCIERMTL